MKKNLLLEYTKKEYYTYIYVFLLLPPTPFSYHLYSYYFHCHSKKKSFHFSQKKKYIHKKNEILADQKASLLCDCLKIFVSKNGNSFDPLSRDYKIMKDSRTNKNIKLKMKFGEKKFLKFHFQF